MSRNVTTWSGTPPPASVGGATVGGNVKAAVVSAGDVLDCATTRSSVPVGSKVLPGFRVPRRGEVVSTSTVLPKLTVPELSAGERKTNRPSGPAVVEALVVALRAWMPAVIVGPVPVWVADVASKPPALTL